MSQSHTAIWSQIVDAIQQHQRFLVTAHVSPDGDAAGSALGLYSLLHGLGKDVVVYNDASYPENLRFLPNADKLTTDLNGEAPFDVTFICDCGELKRTPPGFPQRKDQHNLVIVLDHHKTSACEGDINLNDPNEPSASLLIYQLTKELGAELTLDIAQNVYCALLSDTGGFRYNKTSPRAFRIAAELLEAGVNPWDIASALYESNPIERQRLLQRTLETLELHLDDTLAYLTITQDFYAQEGGTPDLTDGFINFARGIRGVEVAVLFHEQEQEADAQGTPQDMAWKLSMRSRGNVDVSQVASQFGGGGHPNAAGAKLQGDLGHCKQQVYSAMKMVLDRQKELI